jgi:hypothetical protein
MSYQSGPTSKCWLVCKPNVRRSVAMAVGFKPTYELMQEMNLAYYDGEDNLFIYEDHNTHNCVVVGYGCDGFNLIDPNLVEMIGGEVIYGYKICRNVR